MIKVAVVGYGNIGKFSIEAVQEAPDMQLVGLIRRNALVPVELENCGVEVVDDIAQLSVKPDVAILATPTRSVPEFVKRCLELGINTVDSYDIHTNIWDLKVQSEAYAQQYGVVSVHAAGWDPGSDSIVRTLMQAAAPRGITYTNFGPGMSMGHTVAVKAIKGVKGALSMTIPLGTSIHRRMVYVELEDGASFDEVERAIKTDPYFIHDETHVIQVSDVNEYIDRGHGVNMVRKGVSGKTDNQLLSFDMKINNPALTAQILVGAARASLKQQPGAYTLIEIPVIDLLPGQKETLIKELV